MIFLGANGFLPATQKPRSYIEISEGVPVPAGGPSLDYEMGGMALAVLV